MTALFQRKLTQVKRVKLKQTNGFIISGKDMNLLIETEIMEIRKDVYIICYRDCCIALIM